MWYMKHKIFSSILNFGILLFAYFLLFISQVQADSGQYSQYGGGTPQYSIIIDKMVLTSNPTKDGQEIYVDNLAPSDVRFAPGARVTFKIKIKNSSNITLNNVQVKDILPSGVDPIEGPGTFDANTNTINWTYAEVKSGEEKIEKLVVQIKSQNDLPADKGLFCLSNKATAGATNAYDDDVAQFCVEKQVTTKYGQPVTKTPEAGSPLLAIGMLNLLGLGAGIWIKKHTS